MKSINQTLITSLRLILPLLFLFSFNGCDKIDMKEEYVIEIPIYKTLGEIRASNVKLTVARPMHNIGKIYLYKDYILINEPNKGIHFYNNENPENPKSVGFLPISGNYDLGVQNDLLYVDNIVDLLTFDISDISNPKLIDRQKDVFSVKYTSETGVRYQLEDKDMVPFAYKDSLISREEKSKYIPKDQPIYLDYNNSSSGESNQVGQAGSLARFAIAENFLFAIYQDKIKNFDLVNARSPKLLNETQLNFGIETLFPYKKNLFVGANNGMHILDISNPTEPVEIANYIHVVACDPVVVNDNYAFVTLRTGNFCQGNQNQLQVLDIKDLKNPKLIKAYEMKNPHGLALSGDHLFICEGNFGLKSFKVSDVNNIDKNRIQYLEDVKSSDVIAGPKSLIVMGIDGICQFDYKNPSNLKKLSCITKNRN